MKIQNKLSGKLESLINKNCPKNYADIGKSSFFDEKEILFRNSLIIQLYKIIFNAKKKTIYIIIIF